MRCGAGTVDAETTARGRARHRPRKSAVALVINVYRRRRRTVLRPWNSPTTVSHVRAGGDQKPTPGGPWSVPSLRFYVMAGRAEKSTRRARRGTRSASPRPASRVRAEPHEQRVRRELQFLGGRRPG